MATSPMLALRKRLLNIDDSTAHNVRLAAPLLHQHLDSMIDRLYRHLNIFPEVVRFLPPSRIGFLKAKQLMHWRRLLDCHLDDNYAKGAYRVGTVHFEQRLPPFIYLAAYNYLQNLMLACIAESGKFSRGELASILSSVSRVIMLDIDLALSAYTRALWSGANEDEIHI